MRARISASELTPPSECRLPKNDISGMRFNKLTVVGFIGRRNTRSYYECVCDCGNAVNVYQLHIVSGKTKSCGCYQAEKNWNTHFIDISGQKFGRLTAKRFSHRHKKNTYWVVVCECGIEKIVNYVHLVGGKTRSCGCLKKEMLSEKSGERCHLWRGGKGYYKYPREWNTSLKESIRNRDERNCQYPNCSYSDLMQENSLLDVHHIDGNKQNCNPYNLISLCHNHHMKIESSDANKWEEYFYSITGDYR